nr:hypothetical protein Sh265O22g_40 [Saccharum hybrid cultivar R570]
MTDEYTGVVRNALAFEKRRKKNTRRGINQRISEQAGARPSHDPSSSSPCFLLLRRRPSPLLPHAAAAAAA